MHLKNSVIFCSVFLGFSRPRKFVNENVFAFVWNLMVFHCCEFPFECKFDSVPGAPDLEVGGQTYRSKMKLFAKNGKLISFCLDFIGFFAFSVEIERQRN